MFKIPFSIFAISKILFSAFRYWSHPKVDGLEVPSNRNIIPQSLKDFFMQRQLVVVEYFNLTKDTEETMFQLVQRGVALTPAERMRAMSTSWARFSRQYEEDYSMVLKRKLRIICKEFSG